TRLPSSQASPLIASTTPLPQVSFERQSLAQPSLEAWLPSSQTSPTPRSIRPLPHTAGKHTPLWHSPPLPHSVSSATPAHAASCSGCAHNSSSGSITATQRVPSGQTRPSSHVTALVRMHAATNKIATRKVKPVSHGLARDRSATHVE